jgi:hypothetical protein
VSLIAREQVVRKEDTDQIPLPPRKEEKQGDWPEYLGEDIRLPPLPRRKGQKGNDVDW